MYARLMSHTHRIRRIAVLLAAVALPSTWAVAAASAGPHVAEESIKYPNKQEEWYVVKIQDAKCGYMHSFVDRSGNEIHTRVRMHIEIARAEAKVEISTDQRYRETLDGRPLAFSLVMSMGQMPVTHQGTIIDGKVRLIAEQAGVKREQVYDFDPEIRFAWGQLLEQRRRGLVPGTSFTIKVYEPSMKADGPVPLTLTVHEKERVDVLGEKRELYRVTSTMKLDPAAIPGGGAAREAGTKGQGAEGTAGGIEIVTESWVDDDAMPVISTLDMGIMRVNMYRATREQALEVGDAPEMFINTFIHVDRKVPKAAKAVTYRLKLPADAKQKLPDLPATGMQRFKRISDREGLLTVQRIDWAALRGKNEKRDEGTRETHGALRGDAANMAPFLASSTMVDSDDRRIRRLAKRSVRSVEHPADQADAMRKFVTDYVTEKGLDVGFATATEVARTRSGDCTEHAVLLAALARANGIPSRGVSGIIQVPSGPLGADGLKAFGYHMWTQVYIHGQWVDIDAAMRQTDCDVTHIALALMPLGDDGMLESIMGMFPLLGQLELEIVEIEE